MDNHSKNRWDKLFSQLKISFEMTDQLTKITETQFLEFEAKIGMVFPTGYREFCQTFGQGCFSKGSICIDCPLIQDVEGQLISNEEIISAKKAYHENEDLTELQDMLDFAYLFGVGSSRVLFVFDLKSYSELDGCYDICAVDDNGEIYRIGRDFFEFIQEFCIGDRAIEEFPALAELLGIFKKINDDYYSVCFTPTFYLTTEETDRIHSDLLHPES